MIGSTQPTVKGNDRNSQAKQGQQVKIIARASQGQDPANVILNWDTLNKHIILGDGKHAGAKVGDGKKSITVTSGS